MKFYRVESFLELSFFRKGKNFFEQNVLVSYEKFSQNFLRFKKTLTDHTNFDFPKINK